MGGVERCVTDALDVVVVGATGVIVTERGTSEAEGVGRLVTTPVSGVSLTPEAETVVVEGLVRTQT